MRATPSPGPFAPAPGTDRHPALDLANSAFTVPGGRRVDLIGEPADADQWLFERGFAPAGAGLQQWCAGQLRELRAHVRALLAAHVAGRPAPEAALAAVNEALTRAPAASLLRWDPERGLHREVAHPVSHIVEHALAVLAADAAELLTGEDAERLTACGSPPCDRYLLRNGRRTWCSTRCGDRARAARAYARRTRGPSQEPEGPGAD
ncbi:CGNR zinc finger domain-containing protein [Streptomyces thermolilacinus]|uniref:CGNR zinc finger domain-containing protein n=1 Tax=Streptomyces thermolilacinus TaxID=285540 RepID=UPI0033D58C3F